MCCHTAAAVAENALAFAALQPKEPAVFAFTGVTRCASPDAFYTNDHSRVLRAALACFLVSLLQCMLGNPSPCIRMQDQMVNPETLLLQYSIVFPKRAGRQ